MKSPRQESPERPPAVLRAWLPSVVFPAVYLLMCPTQVSGFVLNGQVHWNRPGLPAIGCLTFFWLLVATLQSWAMRRWLPRPARCGVATFLGGLCATAAYPLGGMLLMPLWADLFGVVPKPAGVAPHFIGVNRIHQLMFFALQGMLFGGVIGIVQSSLIPSRWLHRAVFAAISGVAGALAFGLVWFGFTSTFGSYDALSRLLGRSYGVMLNAIGVTKLMPPLAWLIYASIAGVVMDRTAALWWRAKHEGLASRFD